VLNFINDSLNIEILLTAKYIGGLATLRARTMISHYIEDIKDVSSCIPECIVYPNKHLLFCNPNTDLDTGENEGEEQAIHGSCCPDIISHQIYAMPCTRNRKPY